jgi:hypothetical protein
MIRLPQDSQQTIRLELDSDTLVHLLQEGHLSVSDFSCLDGDSKHRVCQLLLEVCCRQLQIHRACSGDCGSCSASRGIVSRNL